MLNTDKEKSLQIADNMMQLPESPPHLLEYSFRM